MEPKFLAYIHESGFRVIGSKSLAAVAAQVGCDSEAAFNRAFKREFGMPPAGWRKNRSQVDVESAVNELPPRSPPENRERPRGTCVETVTLRVDGNRQRRTAKRWRYCVNFAAVPRHKRIRPSPTD